MTQQEIFDIVAGHLSSHFEVPRERVRPEANLFSDLDLDSIDALDMIGLLESELGIELKEAELKKMRTVQDVVDYVLRHRPAEA